MTEFELVRKYQRVEAALKKEGYTVSPINMGFYVHNKKGTIVADMGTIDGLYGFLQAIQWSNAEVQGAIGP